MTVYRASEDSGRGLETYCDREDVYLLMHGIMADEEGDALEAYASSETLNRILNTLLPTTKLDLDDQCGRDFDYHASVSIAVDGQNTDEINLKHWGFIPLLDVTAMSVDDSALTLSEYTWDEDGLIQPDDYWGGYPIFTRGNRNVAMTITWGYTEPPADVIEAQAKLVGIELLKRIRAANAAEPGMIGGAQRVQFGDLTVNNYSRGRYSATLDDWKADVQKVVNRYRRIAVGYRKPKIFDALAATRAKQFDRDV